MKKKSFNQCETSESNQESLGIFSNETVLTYRDFSVNGEDSHLNVNLKLLVKTKSLNFPLGMYTFCFEN